MEDDVIMFEAEFYLIDGPHMASDTNHSYTATVEFNNNSKQALQNSSHIFVEENEHVPVLKMKSEILNHNPHSIVESG